MSSYKRGTVAGSIGDFPSHFENTPSILPGWMIWFEGVRVRQRKFGKGTVGIPNKSSMSRETSSLLSMGEAAAYLFQNNPKDFLS